MPSSRLISFTDLPRARPTSASRSAVMILLRSVSLPSHPDLLAEKLQTRSTLTLHLVSFQGGQAIVVKSTACAMLDPRRFLCPSSIPGPSHWRRTLMQVALLSLACRARGPLRSPNLLRIAGLLLSLEPARPRRRRRYGGTSTARARLAASWRAMAEPEMQVRYDEARHNNHSTCGHRLGRWRYGLLRPSRTRGRG